MYTDVPGTLENISHNSSKERYLDSIGASAHIDQGLNASKRDAIKLEPDDPFDMDRKDIECCANCKYRQASVCTLQIINNIKAASSCYRCEIKENTK